MLRNDAEKPPGILLVGPRPVLERLHEALDGRDGGPSSWETLATKSRRTTLQAAQTGHIIQDNQGADTALIRVAQHGPVGLQAPLLAMEDRDIPLDRLNAAGERSADNGMKLRIADHFWHTSSTGVLRPDAEQQAAAWLRLMMRSS